MVNELKPYPFCGGNKIELSIKTANHYPTWYVAMYCADCHCYGARTKVTITSDGWKSRNMIENSVEAREMAIEAWNRRVTE